MKQAGAVKGKRIPQACAFRIVDAPVALTFEPGYRKSPYFAAIQNLIKAGPGKVIEFDNPGARPSIYAAARKHNMKVMFSELGGKLYLRLQEIEGPESAVCAFLKEGPRHFHEVETHLRSLGLDANAQGILLDLSKNNRAMLVSVGDKKKWKLTE